jgi:hypothetical protein
MDLQQLEIAVIERDTSGIRAFFDACGDARGNEQLLEAGRQYGFHVEIIEAPPANGKALMLGRDLAQVFYGKKDTSGPKQLLRSHNTDFVDIGAFVDEIRRLLIDRFALSKFSGNQVFATWEHFWLIGWHGETPAAREIKAMIMRKVRAYDIAQKVEESTGHSPRQLLTQALQPDLKPEAELKLLAAKEIEGEMAIGRAFQLPDHMIAARAKEMAERVTGLDLSFYLNNSPLMLYVPPEDQFHTISEYSKEFGLKPGVLNKFLHHLNYQTELGTGWTPTAQAKAMGVCRDRSEEKHGKKVVYYVEWKRSFIAQRILPWLRQQPSAREQ